MSYILFALVVERTVKIDLDLGVAPIGSDLRLIPLTATNSAKIAAASSPGHSAQAWGFEELDSSTVRYAERLSAYGRVAYIHAEFHGGTGIQAAVGWAAGNVALAPIFTATHEFERLNSRYEIRAFPDLAVNVSLRFLGAIAVQPNIDEFDTVGLALHRSTDDWL